MMRSRNIAHGITYCILLCLAWGCASAPTTTTDPAFEQTYGDYSYCACPVVRQSTSNSCGLASLVSVLGHWGVDVTEPTLKGQYPPRLEDGYLIFELRDIAGKLGLDAYAIMMQPDPMVKLREQIAKGRPVICAVKYPRSAYFAEGVPIYGSFYRLFLWSFGPVRNHFLVVFGVKDDSFLLMDPAHGYATLSEERLRKCWDAMDCSALLCARRQ